MNQPSRDIVHHHSSSHQAHITQRHRNHLRSVGFEPAPGDTQSRSTTHREPLVYGQAITWRAPRFRRGIAGLALLFAAAGPVSALPVFNAGWGLNTINAPFDASLIGNDPVSGGNSRTTTWPFDRSLEFYTVTASADANRGVVGVLARISVARNTSIQTARVEAVASMQGTVQLCAPGGPPGVCTPPTPGVPVPIPYPNFQLSTTNTLTDSRSLAIVSLIVAVNGDAVASHRLTGVAGLQTVGPAGGATTGLFTSTGAFDVNFDLGAIVSCATTGCVAAVDASHSLGFIEGAPAFLGLPDGWTVWSEELNIADNRWTDPRVSSEPPSASVPAPATIPLILCGLTAFATWRPRARPLGEEQPAVHCGLA